MKTGECGTETQRARRLEENIYPLLAAPIADESSNSFEPMAARRWKIAGKQSEQMCWIGGEME